MTNIKSLLSSPWLWFGLAMSLFAFLTPYAFDNNVFEAELLDKIADVNLLQGFWKYVDTVRINDNWRLAQIIAPLLTLYVPKWLTACITGVASAVTLYILARLVSPHSASALQSRYLQAILIWMLLLFLPWRNNLLINIFTLNYVTVAATALLCFYLTTCTPHTRVSLLFVFIFAILTAIGHEQIALSCSAGMVCAALVPERKSKNTFLLGTLMIILGAIWVLTSHLVVRAGSEVTYPAWKSDTVRIILGNALVFLLWIYIFACALFNKRSSYLFALARRSPAFVFFSVASVTGTFISLFVSYAPRSAYWPQLCAIGAWSIILYPILMKPGSRVQTVFVATSLLLLTILSIHVSEWISRIGGEYSAAEVKLIYSDSGTVYCRPVYAYDVPKTTLGLTPNVLFMEPMVFHSLSVRHGRAVAFVPSELKEVPVPTTIDSIYTSPGGYFYMHTRQPLEDACITEACSNTGPVPVALLPFTHPSGEELILIIPHRKPDSAVQQIILPE